MPITSSVSNVQTDHRADLDLIADLAAQAGQIALRYFKKDPEVWMKPGDSPVSEADYAVDHFLKEKLLEARPDYGWLSEETDLDDSRLDTPRTFVVDPIDGTRGFIQGLCRWCVSVAVVEANRPIAGVLDCPAIGEQFTALTRGGAHLNGERLIAAAPQTKTLRLTGPRALQTTMDRDVPQQVKKAPFVPSLAYRIAMVAKGKTDVAVARASAKDWDLAAADLIAQESGAILTGLDGEMLKYNCQDVRHGALVCAHTDHHREMLGYVRRAMDEHQKP
ncbi:MAG: 3'(2'),5'-bisphosphate nucleotidase CysQ [Pseudomonadota bacterium]